MISNKYIVLNDRQICDLEMLLNGGFAPLKGFLNKRDYDSVLENSRLASSGDLWPIPIVLGTDENKFVIGDTITLRNEENLPIATMYVEDIYEPNYDKECISLFGSGSGTGSGTGSGSGSGVEENHPYYKEVIRGYQMKRVKYIGGPVTVIQMPPHFDFVEHRLTPAQTKQYFAEHKWDCVVAFQTRNPMHRSHYELTLNALKTVTASLEGLSGAKSPAKLLLHPVVGETQDCDVSYPVRVRCYKKMLKHYPENTVLMALLPLSMRMAGPKEALWHALIRQNYGCTHFIIGRDHAGPSSKRQNGQPFYDPYGAHELLEQYKSELKIKIVPSQMIVYVEQLQKYLPMDQIPAVNDALVPSQQYTVLNISGTEQRTLLTEGKDIPEWFTFPEISEELKTVYKPKKSRGFCVYFIGLSGSGKTTLAKALQAKLEETTQTRTITLLDGDVVRQNLSRELGFSKEHRSINVRRIGYVASEIVKHGGICLCANIAPYQADRDYNKKQITFAGQTGQTGGYIEVYMNTPLTVCEERDIKGLYKKARTGEIPVFTGVTDTFEEPTSSDVVCSVENTIGVNVEIVFKKLQELGFV